MLIKMLEMPMAPIAGAGAGTSGKTIHSYSFQCFNFKGQLPHY
jgi:hypothetical protein